MAELAVAALASMGLTTGATLATTAVASAGAVGTAAATATGLSANLLGVLSGVATAASVLGTLNAGFEDARQANQMAAETDLQAGQEQLADTQRQLQLKRELLQVLGQNTVALAAAGIDTGGGIAATQAREASQQSLTDLTIDRRDSDLRRAMLRARAQGYRQAAGSAIGGALLKSVGQVASGGIDFAARG